MEPISHNCDVCQEQFDSKNKLFKHLKTHGLLVGWKSKSNKIKQNKGDIWIKDCILDTKSKSIPVEEIEYVEQCLWNAIDHVEVEAELGSDIFVPGQRRKGFARSTSCAARASYLLSTEEYSSVADLFCFQIHKNYKLNDNQWLEIVNKHLPEHANMSIRVHQIQYLPNVASAFHAETNCSQRVYEYIVPYELIFNCNSSNSSNSSNNSNSNKTSDSGSDLDSNSESQQRNLEEELKIKKELKNIFNLFQNSKKYHNFVIGGSTPDENVTHRKIDKIKLKEIVTINNKNYCIFSFSGDSFLRGQIRKIMGIIIAVLYKYLSIDYICDALTDRIYDIPMWSGLGVYLNECRYDKFEARFDGYSFNNAQDGPNSNPNPNPPRQNRKEKSQKRHRSDKVVEGGSGKDKLVIDADKGTVPMVKIQSSNANSSPSASPPPPPLPPPGLFRLDPRRYSAQTVAHFDPSQSASHVTVMRELEGYRSAVQNHIATQMELEMESQCQSQCRSQLLELQQECIRLSVIKDKLVCLYGRNLVLPPCDASGTSGVTNPNTNTNGSATHSISSYMELSIPDLKAAVLQHLRSADQSDSWPSSTLARQKIIEDSTLVEHGSGGSGGSFSVGTLPAPLSPPKGNELFPGMCMYICVWDMYVYNILSLYLSNYIYLYTNITITI